jgi:hypothetical protein
MNGTRPYQGKSRKEIRDQILAKQVQIKKHEIPEDWSIEAADFINRVISNQLLQRKPINRLGLNGPQEVKSHPWLADFPWDKLLERSLVPSFMPNQSGENFDTRLQLPNDPWKDSNSDALQQSLILLRQNSTQNLFVGYFYDEQQQNILTDNVTHTR